MQGFLFKIVHTSQSQRDVHISIISIIYMTAFISPLLPYIIEVFIFLLEFLLCSMNEQFDENWILFESQLIIWIIEYFNAVWKCMQYPPFLIFTNILFFFSFYFIRLWLFVLIYHNFLVALTFAIVRFYLKYHINFLSFFLKLEFKQYWVFWSELYNSQHFVVNN